MIDAINILTGALTQALETMAYMEITSVEEDMPVPEDLRLVEIDFMGPKTGMIQILAGRTFAATLAENIAALDEATDADCDDALKELSNVTCGLITPMVADDCGDIFNLTIPSLNHDDCAAKWQEFVCHEDGCILNVEGQIIAAKLVMHD